MVIIVIELMTGNCGLVGVLWFNHYHRNTQVHAQRPPQGQAFEYLTRELRLTPDQEKRYDTLRQQHVSFTQQTSADQRIARDTFFELVKQSPLDKPRVSALTKLISADQQKLDSATFYHFRSFRAILNSTQQARFDSIFQNVLHMMSQPRRQGAPGAGPGGPPPNGGSMQGPPPNGRPEGRGGHPDGQLPPPGAIDHFGPKGHPSSPPANGEPPKGWLPVIGPRGKQILTPDGKPLYAPPGSHTARGKGPMPDGPPPGEGPPPGGGPPPNGGPPPMDR